MVTFYTSSPLMLHNTLTRTKEQLKTGQPDSVSLYVCGPTVYNFAHIGNARPAVVFDLLSRVLRYFYPKVMYVRNFTDVDDKINAAAAAENVAIQIISERFIRAYEQDMAALGVLEPDAEPRVTEHIGDIIAMIKTLCEQGHAYVAQGHVLFRVSSFAGYGALSGRKTEDMLAGARVEVAPYKHDPMDFVLWKPSSGNMPGWESPWGWGRPGWHIECSAMIQRHVGTTLDIHGGGQDLIFPHHENEIAQGTCYNQGALYCRTWVHNSFVTVDGRKMSKSTGNVLLVQSLLKQYPGEVIRYALLSTHYRSPLDWTSERIRDARTTMAGWYQVLHDHLDELEIAEELTDIVPDPVFLDALCDDLNIGQAIARIHVLVKNIRNESNREHRIKSLAVLKKSAFFLGILQQPPEFSGVLSSVGLRSRSLTAEETVWLREREQARLNRDFNRSDELRRMLQQTGIQVMDSAAGQSWSFILPEIISDDF